MERIALLFPMDIMERRNACLDRWGFFRQLTKGTFAYGVHRCLFVFVRAWVGPVRAGREAGVAGKGSKGRIFGKVIVSTLMQLAVSVGLYIHNYFLSICVRLGTLVAHVGEDVILEILIMLRRYGLDMRVRTGAFSSLPIHCWI